MKATDITTAISHITCDYVTKNKRCADGHRAFIVEGIYDKFFVELLLSMYEDIGPLHIRAEVVKGDTVLSFVSTPDQQGIEHLTIWLKATLAMELGYKPHFFLKNPLTREKKRGIIGA